MQTVGPEVVRRRETPRPWIGIPLGYDQPSGRLLLDRRYVEAIESAGGTVVPVSVLSSRESIVGLAAAVDGVLLPGSPTDLDPARYGQERHVKLGRLCPERDEADFVLLEIAEKRSLPVLGICHGMQTLNVWRGGSLVQDIPSEISPDVVHQNPGRPREVPSHAIRIECGSRLGRIFGGNADVNSFHHQAVRVPGRGLRIVATAPDGVVEAIEDTSHSFVIGVQWHPETGWETSREARLLFSSFVQAATGDGID